MSQKDMDDVKKALAAIDAKKKNIRAKIYLSIFELEEPEMKDARNI